MNHSIWYQLFSATAPPSVTFFPCRKILRQRFMEQEVTQWRIPCILVPGFNPDGAACHRIRLATKHTLNQQLNQNWLPYQYPEVTTTAPFTPANFLRRSLSCASVSASQWDLENHRMQKKLAKLSSPHGTAAIACVTPHHGCMVHTYVNVCYISFTIFSYLTAVGIFGSYHT